MQLATFGGGCFWCMEAIFQLVKGVENVICGYAGGDVKEPDYRAISSGKTRHAEVVQITFDTEVISYEELITIFMSSHDPSSLNSQGADHGTQYRSIVLFHNEKQKELVKNVISRIGSDFSNPIVTDIIPFDRFYIAENYHQNYYQNNPHAGYCKGVIVPKLKLIQSQFAEKLIIK